MKPLHLVGIINMTPDSFSDGGECENLGRALERIHQLMAEGADIIDIGGDSTRPGSVCVGEEEELRRITPLLHALPDGVSFSVDTHHASVAQFAIEHGAMMINDVLAGQDPEMFSVIAGSHVQYVMMFSRCERDHSFREASYPCIIESVKRFFSEKIEQAIAAGVAEQQIILDPGMGKFISDSAEDSWRIIREIDSLCEFQRPLYIGASRKGFLKLPLEQEVTERDILTAHVGKIIAQALNSRVPLWLRVHNIASQRRMLQE